MVYELCKASELINVSNKYQSLVFQQNSFLVLKKKKIKNCLNPAVSKAIPREQISKAVDFLGLTLI